MQFEVLVLQRGQAGLVLLGDVVAGRLEFGDRGIQIPGRPQYGGVQDQAECGELVFLAVTVGLDDVSAFAAPPCCTVSCSAPVRNR